MKQKTKIGVGIEIILQHKDFGDSKGAWEHSQQLNILDCYARCRAMHLPIQLPIFVRR